MEECFKKIKMMIRKNRLPKIKMGQNRINLTKITHMET
jgi:hypothetical protein